MGRIKEFCIDLINANGGIPENITIEDVVNMEKLNLLKWEEYEREQEKNRLQLFESENPGKIAKIEESERKFTNPEHKGEQHKDC
jgi:hypothetical protein